MVKTIMVIFKDIAYKPGFNITTFMLVWIGSQDTLVDPQIASLWPLLCLASLVISAESNNWLIHRATYIC